MLSWLAAITIVGLAMTVGGMLARWWWVADLATHFPMQLALILVTCGILLLALRSAVWATLALAAALFHGLAVAPLFLAPPKLPTTNAVAVKVMLANVRRANTDVAAVLDLVRQEAPDVAVLIETDQAWLDGLAPLAAPLPYWATQPRGDDFGLAILSRYPLDNVITHTLGAMSLPALEARVELPTQGLQLVAAHPPPPTTAAYSAERNRVLGELAALVRGRPGRLVLCGDLNTSPWSPHFKDFLSSSRLVDTRRGHGVQPTWNSVWPRLMRVPIDHCLVSTGIGVDGFRQAAPIGSDHLPLVLDLALPRE
jgi:endonuclease/exonuclease/phosphatase (EEP) superfamily protein YafD